jgi:histidinol-phosphate aminotransferase
MTTGTRPPGTRPAVRSDLRGLEGYHSPQVDVAVRLNTNESPFAPPDGFLDAWTAAIRGREMHRYPDRGAGALRAAIGAHLGQPADRVFCANGSNEVLQTLLLTYGGPGATSLVFEPTYALHSHISRLTGTTVVEGERRADFSIDPHDARQLVEQHQPAVTFICSPNNPTGTVEPHALVEAVLEVARGLVVVDEAYGEFAPRSAMELVHDDRALVVVRTYSKVWSLAGVRLGFCVAPAWLVAELDKVVLPYHLSVPTQLAGELAVRWQPEMDARVTAIVAERERLAAALTARGDLEVFDSGANFVLLRCPGTDPGSRADAADALWQDLLARGVLVRSFARWPRLEGCLRVTIGTRDEDDAFLAALADARGPGAAPVAPTPADPQEPR